MAMTMMTIITMMMTDDGIDNYDDNDDVGDNFLDPPQAQRGSS